MPRSRFFLAAFAAFAIAMPVAAADVSHHFFENEISTTAVNPCNGEVVVLTGTCRAHVTSWVDEDGSLRGSSKNSCHFDGIGSYGNRYVANETYFSRGDVPATCTAEEYPVDSTSDRALLISQTSADNFWLRVTITFLHPLCFEGPPQVIVDGETDCRG